MRDRNTLSLDLLSEYQADIINHRDYSGLCLEDGFKSVTVIGQSRRLGLERGRLIKKWLNEYRFF